VLDEIVVTRSTSPRSVDPAELAEIAEDVFRRGPRARGGAPRRRARPGDRPREEGGLVGGGVLATGSITLAADVRRLLHAR
jgi:dihydrofolate synthase/folylpolyglutamate synthase